MENNFKHSQFAHCESGVISTLISSYGLKLSEPMAFGITSTLSFVFIPLVKINGMPLIAYRDLPKNIVKKISKVLNIKMNKKVYSNKEEANKELTSLVNDGNLVGLQTSVFYLPYFPKDMRFHFNAHNLLVYGKENNDYLISDPVFEEEVKCNENELNKARFAKSMLTPFPFAGVKGMNKLAKKISTLKRDNNDRFLKNYLTHIVRMQEEIGTGGGGFRFLYAAFLSESKQYNLDEKILDEASALLIKSGNTLREFALLCVSASKNLDKFDAKIIAQKLEEASSYEKEAFTLLKKI